MSAPSPKKRVLFFTNSEHGQSQVHLAISYELLSHPDIEVHLASFPALAPRISGLASLIAATDDGSPSTGKVEKQIPFHSINYPAMTEAYNGAAKNVVKAMMHAPGFFNALTAYDKMPSVITSWTPECYMDIYKRCSEIMEEVKPAVIIIDSIFPQPLDLCRNQLAGKPNQPKYAIVNPLDAYHLLVGQQPWLAQLWKYPAFCSAYTFPLPWYKIVLNIYLCIRLAIVFAFSPPVWRLSNYRKKHGLTGMYPAFIPWREDETYLTPAIPDLDYPVQIPKNVECCGPILIPCPPVSTSDPELAAWLAQRRTILINLGSHIVSEGTDALEIAKALQTVLSRHADLQVLWKLKSEITPALTALLAAHATRVKILSWLDTDPIAILASGHICCTIHHGGANSFYEAVASSIPQVVLPVWYDTYNFANRVEYLGIGVWASKSSAPNVNAKELADGVLQVLDEGKEAERRRETARWLGRLCRERGGRRRAAETVLAMLGMKSHVRLSKSLD